MPIFKRDDVELYYEEHGAGFPVLLIAPGGMRSAVSFWERTPWNPIEQLAPHYRVIAMDQRNAGKSVAPIRATDSWHVYTADQVALLDHPGGLDDNRQAFFEMFDSWANELRLARPEVSATTWESFKQSMYGGDFLFNVSRAFVSRCQTPLLVLLGNDLYHPESSSRELAALAPNATLIEHWKEPEHQPAAKKAVEEYLAKHTPR